MKLPEQLQQLKFLQPFVLLSPFFLTAGCTSINIPFMFIQKTLPPHSSPVGNLTLADVLIIPILSQAINETLTSNSSNQLKYKMSQDEWDQIVQLFSSLDLPPQPVGSTSWYISFEGSLIHIFLTHLVD